MEIQKRTVHRRITEQEFLRLKNLEPFATYRQDAKPINFGFIFGMSFRKFSMSVLETNWKYERVQQFIKEKNLYENVEKMAERFSDQDAKTCEYWAVSNYIRTQYFESYPGLMERITRNKAFAIDNGYIRSFHGAIRRVPMMLFAFNEDGKMRKDENAKEIANLINITANSTIQTDEVVTAMIRINEWCTENGIESRIVGMVHDSIDFYVAKREDAPKVLQHMKEVFEKEEAWQKGLPILTDITVCDLNNPDHYYKHGTDMKKMLEQLEGK